MTNKLSYIIAASGITAVINGETHSITRDNASYLQVQEAISEWVKGEDTVYLADLFRTANAIRRYTKGAISIAADGSALSYKGEEINNVVVDRILAFMSDGLPVGPLIAFLERLLANPSRRSVQELYKFLEKGNMPITDDGFFLGYKGVQDNYLDVHSGTFDNSPGQVLEMKRREVDDNSHNDCSYGFHVGSLEYATSWGPRTVLVKVDPADVVSVPHSDANKLRTCKYEVIGDFEGALNGVFVGDTERPYDRVPFLG